VNLNSLRFRLIWIHSAVIAIVVVCIGLVRYQLASYRSHQRFDAVLVRDAQFFVSRFKPDPAGFVLSAEGLSTANAVAIHELEHYFVVTDLSGRILHEDPHNRFVRYLFHRGELDGILRQRSGLGKATAKDGSRYRFFSLSVPPGILPQPAIVHIGRSMEMQEGVMHEYLLFYIYSVPLILVISVALGWFFADRALKPFEAITETAEKINYENLNAKIVTAHKEEEIQRLVQSFNAMVKRLDDSFRQMRKFNADAAHELRTPLAIIQGETEVALQSQNLPEELRSVLASNLEELDRLTRIVNDLLTLSEAEVGKQVLAKEPTDIRELLEDLVDQMRLLASDRNLRIDLRCASELWIEADKLWIRRAVLNLLDNAIKYSKDGGTIEVSAGREDSNVRVRVRDSGIGIHPDDLPFIFNRLYRADPARNRDSGGAGLGLALVKWVIEAHGGAIRVESEPDRGATFEIFLPGSGQPVS
jgi:two-component system, OmpR family, sensor kinase